MAALPSKNPQGWTIFHNPQFRSSVSRCWCKIAAKWREFDLPNRKIVSIVYHQRSFSLQTPPSYCVIIAAREQMFIADRDTNGEHRTNVANQFILVSVRYCLNFCCLWFRLYFCFLLFLLLFHWFFFFLFFCLLFQVLGYLVSDEIVDCQYVMRFLAENEDFDRAVRHACCQNSPWVAEERAIHLSIRIQHCDRPHCRWVFL